MIPKILLLVKQIRPRTAQIDNLRAPIPIFFQPRALEAVEGVRDALIRSTLTVSSASVVSTYYVKKGKNGEKKIHSPPRRTRRTCSDNCQRSIRRRCGRGSWGARSCRRRGICRRICRRGGRWRCRVACGTLLDRCGFRVLAFFLDGLWGGDVRDLRVMARHFLLLWVRRGEDELMWSCFVGVGGDVGRKEGVEGSMASNCSDLSALWGRAGIIKTWSRATSASCCNILASKV